MWRPKSRNNSIYREKYNLQQWRRNTSTQLNSHSLTFVFLYLCCLTAYIWPICWFFFFFLFCLLFIARGGGGGFPLKGDVAELFLKKIRNRLFFLIDTNYLNWVFILMEENNNVGISIIYSRSWVLLFIDLESNHFTH
jgi:hypothetical protein